MGRRIKAIYLCLLSLMMVTSLRAEEVSLEATISADKILLKEAAQLTLTVSGAKSDVGPINLPTIDGFDVKYIGPSTRISIVNGNYHSERSFSYSLFPNKVGHFIIPSITATISNQEYATKPIDIDVVDAPAGESGTAVDQGTDSAQGLKDKIYIRMSVPRQEVYLNEKVPLTVRLLVSGVPMQNVSFPQIDKNGFAMDDFPNYQQGSELINGVKFDTVEFKTFIYPIRLGDLVIPGARIEGNLIYKQNTGQNSGQDGFFGNSMFKNFFDPYMTRPATMTASALHLNVLPLPQSGQPVGFSGAVGQFDFTASVSPLEVKVGDPLTLRIMIKGDGSLRGVRLPLLNDDQFKVYEPQVKDQPDGKMIEQVIIPTSDKVTQVGVLQFSFFDPVAKAYLELTQGPFPIKVVSPKPGEEFKAVGFNDITQEGAAASTSGGVFVAASQMAGQLMALAKRLVKNKLFWLALLGIVLVGAGVNGWRHYQHRLAHDHGFARRVKAVKEARHLLAQAGQALRAQHAKDFYTLVAKALRDYLANKWHKPAASLTVKEIEEQLIKHHAQPDVIQKVKEILSVSDLVCFASASRNTTHMTEDLKACDQLIMTLEKQLK